MKYTREQKEIMRQIQNGTIFDIPSFSSYYNLQKHIVIDKTELDKRFDKEISTKKYYYPVNLRRNSSNVITEAEYLSKIDSHEINPCSYTSTSLSLKHDIGIKTFKIGPHEVTVDLYDGINIAESFSKIYEFLILWQHLKKEMLIQECPSDNDVETLNLLFAPVQQTANQSVTDKSILNYIDYETFTISDKYLVDCDYIFCTDAYYRCQEFIGKKIYPSMQLSLFVKNNFETFNEVSQKKSLHAAWAAILVSIILALYPYISNHLQSDPYISYVNQIQASIIELEEQTEELSGQLETIAEIYEDHPTKGEIFKTLQLIYEKISQLEKLLTESQNDVP